MDKGLRAFKETFWTRCSLVQLLCLLGGLLSLSGLGAGSTVNDSIPCPVSTDTSRPTLLYYSLEASEHRDSIITAGRDAGLQLYGREFTNNTRLWLTDQMSCSEPGITLYPLGPVLVLDEEQTYANITVPGAIPGGVYYFCIGTCDFLSELQGGSEDDPELNLIIEQSSSSETSFKLPLAAEIVFIVILILLSGTFSGLNLGLMSLDPTTLKLVMESGSGRQKIYAKLIYRVRRYGNYLLCTLLLGNVLVNNSLAILLDGVLGSGVYAIIASTIAIVIFGEIVPQAICSRHALTIGAYTIWLTYIFMALTFPLSFPISLILHFILGKEIGAVYTREELLGLLKVTEDHHDIGKDEVQIISGALKFKEKTAEDVMTKFEYVYCINIQSVLDFKTIGEIYDSGFSRIPVYEETKSNIVGVLYAKDLAFVDPDDETPLKQILDFYQRELTSVYNDTKLNELLEQFAGGQCHLALVNEVVQEGSGDPQLHVVGVVTLEDIVEEILQLEIVDETDRIVDNRTLKPRQRNQVDIGGFMRESPGDQHHITSQQRMAVYQFLSSSVAAFKSDKIRPSILRRLLLQDVVRRYTQEEIQTRNLTLYRPGSPSTSFTLILEGHLEVEVGRDGLKFEAGPFYHFGVQALEMADSKSGDYIPDFTLRPVSNCLLLVITCKQYLDTRKATMFQSVKDHDSSSNSPLTSRVEPRVSSPGRKLAANGRTNKSETVRRSLAKKLSLASRVGGGEESHRLLEESVLEEEAGDKEEEEEELLLLPNALISTGDGTSTPDTVEVELHDIGSGVTVPSLSNDPSNTSQT